MRLQLIGNIINIALNIIFFVIVGYVSYKLIQQYNNSKLGLSSFLFYNGMFFNIVTFSAAFGLFIFAIFSLEALLNDTFVESNKSYMVYHSFWVMFYGKQNCVMLLILFTRLRIVFENTSMALSKHSVLFFNVCFAIALILFTLLPILHIINPNISIWTWCASTSCFYNLSFMMTLTSLFLYKLKQVFTNYIQLNEQAQSQYGVKMEDDEQRLENEKMVKTFTKTSVLAFTSILFTSVSCILLVVRFTFNINSHFIYTLSEWIISIDIYSNFLFITLSYTYFDNIYYKICGLCDNQCQLLWYKLLFAEESKKLNEIVNDNNATETNSNEGGDISNPSNASYDDVIIVTQEHTA